MSDVTDELAQQVLTVAGLIEDRRVLEKLADVANRRCYLPKHDESDEDAAKRINERFDVIEAFTYACTEGQMSAFVAAGPGGTGKSWTVESCLIETYEGIDTTEAPYGTAYRIEKGYTRATDLYRQLWHTRFKGNVLVLDEADTIWYDVVALPLLKSVLDTTRHRVAKWGTEWRGVAEDGETIPHRFDYEGAVIFLTNTDLYGLASKPTKLAPHLQALLSRTHYIDTTMRSRRDYIIRMHEAIKQGMLSHLTEEQRADVMRFISRNQDHLREFSLRIAMKIGNLRALSESNWEAMARMTCLNGG